MHNEAQDLLLLSDMTGKKGRRVDLVDVRLSLPLTPGGYVPVNNLRLRHPSRHLDGGERAGLAGARREVYIRLPRG